jgi:uncharacterized membrane protein YbhN (UPF0104 family)
VNDAPRRRRKFAVKVLASAVVLALTIRWIGVERFTAALRTLDVGSFALVLGAFLATHAAAAFKWRAFLGLAGARFAVAPTLRAYGAGLFANLFLPSMIGGDVARAGILLRGSRRKTAVVVGSLLDRLSDFFGLALLAAGGLLAMPQALAESGGSAALGRRILGWCAGLALVGIGGGVLLLRLRPPARWPIRARGILLRALLGLRRAGRRKAAATAAVVAAVLLQAVLLLLNAELGRRMGVAAALEVWFVAWPLAKIAAMLPLSLAGLGVREAAFAGICSRFGVDAAGAAAASLAWQGVLYCGGLCGGVAFAASRRGTDKS